VLTARPAAGRVRPEGEFTVVAPRARGSDYDVEPAGDRLLILHNDGAENFEIATRRWPIRAAGLRWCAPGRHRLLGVDAFAYTRWCLLPRDGLTGLRILRKGGPGGEGGAREAGPAGTIEVAFASRSTGSGRAEPEFHAAGSGCPTPPW